MIDPKKNYKNSKSLLVILVLYTYTQNIKSAWKIRLNVHSLQAIKTMRGEYFGQICKVVVHRLPFNSLDRC